MPRPTRGRRPVHRDRSHHDGGRDPENGAGTARFCCVGYECQYDTGSSTGAYQLVPEEL